MTTTAEHHIEQFFVEFEQASHAEDWARYGDLFLPHFLNLDPSSAGPVARDALIAFLPHRKGLFDRAGATGTSLAGLEIESIDARHALARTSWTVSFDNGRDPVVLHSTFLLRLEDRWRIAVYLNHGTLSDILGVA